MRTWDYQGTKGGHYFELPKVWQVASIGYVFYIRMRVPNHQNMICTLIVQGWARFSTFSPGLYG